MNLWTVLASLLCSLSLSDAAFQVQQQVRLAAVGSPAAIGRLSDVVARMAGSEAAVAAPPVAQPVLVKLTPPSSYKDDMAALTNWVGTQGRQNKLQGIVAELLGLNEGVDIPCLRKAYQDEHKVLYIFYLVPVNGGMKNVMVHMTSTHSMVWLVSDDGRIERAGEFSQAHSGVVPNDQYASAWVATKDYLLGEMRKASDVAQGSARPKS